MKSLLKILGLIVIVGILVFLFHFNSTKNVNPTVESYYAELKTTLREKGYKSNLLVICTNRSKFENLILQKISFAAPQSRHLKGEAIDFLVFNVNNDGKINGDDVDIIYKILDTKIVKDKGGIGTYKKQRFLFKQMVHIDCKGTRARWNY